MQNITKTSVFFAKCDVDLQSLNIRYQEKMLGRNKSCWLGHNFFVFVWSEDTENTQLIDEVCLQDHIEGVNPSKAPVSLVPFQ